VNNNAVVAELRNTNNKIVLRGNKSMIMIIRSLLNHIDGISLDWLALFTPTSLVNLPEQRMVQPMSNISFLSRKEIIDDNNFMSFHHKFVN